MHHILSALGIRAIRHVSLTSNVCISGSKYSAISLLCPKVIITGYQHCKFSTVNNEVKIYDGNLTRQIKSVKIFSLASSIVGLVAQPILYKQLEVLNSIPVSVAAFSVVGFFTFVTPFLLHLITKKYVTEIYFVPNSEQYVATTINFFLVPKKITFTPSEVHVPDVPGMFTSFQIKGVPLFVEPQDFEDPWHYGRIMGYDKPLDLKLGPDKDDDEAK